MEGLPILIFILFMLMSVVEKVLKKPGPDDKPPPGRRVPPRPPGARRPGERRPVQPLPRPLPPLSTGGQATGRADEMIPEDFWRELTGQARTPRPAPPPAEASEPLSWDDEAVAAIEAAADEEAPVSEERSLETYRREIVVHEPPRIVSLETMPLSPERRHAAYHERLNRTAPALARARPADSPATALRRRLHDPAGARDAFVLGEILGRPKGLE